MDTRAPGSDPIYKRLYSARPMVEDLLRSLFDDAELGARYETLEKLPADYVGDDFRQRRGDTVWRLDTDAAGAGRSLRILVLLEFQSASDATMALRVMEYTGMLYKDLLRTGGERLGELPPVLPVVLYTGDRPWRAATDVRDLIARSPPRLAPYQPSQRYAMLDVRHASADDPRLPALTRAVVRLERSRSPGDLAAVAKLLAAQLDAAAHAELRQAFADWLWVLSRRLGGGPAPADAPPAPWRLEDAQMTLEERVAEWPKPYIRQGREEGISLGREEGISLGREQGLEQQRLLLRRLASVRFGDQAGARLAEALRAETDPVRLLEVGEEIVRCATAADLLRKIAGVE